VISVFVIAVTYWPEMARWRDGPRMVDAVNGWTPVGSTLQWLGERFNLPAHPCLLGINTLANFSKDGHDQLRNRAFHSRPSAGMSIGFVLVMISGGAQALLSPRAKRQVQAFKQASTARGRVPDAVSRSAA